jgi:hypothetical protein
MFCYDYVLAAVLLSAPAEAPVDPSRTAFVRPALLVVAIDAEILDPREEHYWQSPPQDVPGDLQELRQRWTALAFAPRLAECERLPSRKEINDLLAVNRAYRNDLMARLEVDAVHAEELKIAIDETDQLYRVWEAARDARCAFYYVAVRRQALQQLREMVGPRAFYSGELPPALPYWHFPRAR